MAKTIITHPNIHVCALENLAYCFDTKADVLIRVAVDAMLSQLHS
jgi:hypothetical protein